MRAVAVTPAKVILFGEHFVVGGNTAISMAINLPTTVAAELQAGKQIVVSSEDLELEAGFSEGGRIQVLQKGEIDPEKTLRPIFEIANLTLKKLNRTGRGLRLIVKSQVPIGMGLGSSAATAVGTVSAITTLLRQPFSREQVFEAAYALERMVHGHPSGIDQATVTYGGLISYSKGQVEARLQTSKPPSLIIGNTRVRRSTGEFVGKVSRLRETQPEEYAKPALEAQRIVQRAIEVLKNGGPEDLGSLMNANQQLLEMVGVSSPELERLITAARSAGAFGAKLTGGGGGGCMIAAVDDKNRAAVARAILEAGGDVVPSEFVSTGVETSLTEK